MNDQETTKAKSTAVAKVKAPASSQVIAAESVQAEEVPTIPLDSLRALSTLQPEVLVRPVGATQTTTVPEPLVAQPSEYHRSLGEWTQIWWDGIRPTYLSFAILPLLLGSALAWLPTITPKLPRGDFHFQRFVLALVAVIFLQLGANLINDYYDYLDGVDTSNSLGPGGLIQQGLIKPSRVLMLGFALLVVGVIAGCLAALQSGWLTFGIGAIGIAIAYFYSAPPRSLASLTLGEVVSFWAFGPLMTLGAYTLQLNRIDSVPLIYGVSLGLLLTGAVYLNNMRDIESDVQARRHTLATLLDVRANRVLCTLLLLGAYVPILLLGVPSHGPHLILITLWTLPGMSVVLLGMYRTMTPASLHLCMRQLLKLAMFFVLLLIVAVSISTYWQLWPRFGIPGLPFLF